MKPEAGKYYITKDGRRAYVCGPQVDIDLKETGNFVGVVQRYGKDEIWNAEGVPVEGNACTALASEWKKPKEIKGWLSIYFDRDGAVKTYFDKTREEADRNAAKADPSFLPRSACLAIECVEGDGLKQ